MSNSTITSALSEPTSDPEIDDTADDDTADDGLDDDDDDDAAAANPDTTTPSEAPQTTEPVAPVTTSVPPEAQEPTTPAADNQPPDTTITVEPSSTSVFTQVISADGPAPITNTITSIVEVTPDAGQSSLPPVVVVVTSISPAATTVLPTGNTATGASASQTTTAPASLSGNNGNGNGEGGSGGLSTGGRTAIAVVVPVVVVALLLLAGIFLWRRRKQKKAAEEARRKEVEDYGFNPNNDPTLPAVAASEAGGTQMAEDSNPGYRGWGAAAAAGGAAAYSHHKTSTTLSGGHTQGQPSDSGSNSYSYQPGSPSGIDSHSGDPLVGSGGAAAAAGGFAHTNNNRNTMSSDDLGALGSAPLAANNKGIQRGPSNASSRYSATGRSEGSIEPVPDLPASYGDYSGNMNNPSNGYGYSQAGPYGDGSYGGGQGGGGGGGMPVVRDVSARRNTRIEQPSRGYGNGNSGIAQNF